jgi:quercetin dioxygenase-like cupin family protein
MVNRPDRTGRLLHGTMETFDLQAVMDLVKAEKEYTEKGHNALTLVKNPLLSIVLICLKENARLHEHTAPGPITLTILEGRISFSVPSSGETKPAEVSKGQFLVLEENRPHEVIALAEGAFLLTIVT